MLPAQYLRQVQEHTGGEYMALPLRDPHVLWGVDGCRWWASPLFRHGRGHKVCDQVQESSSDKWSTPLNDVFLQEQLRIQVFRQPFSSPPVYSEALVERPCTIVLAALISTMLLRLVLSSRQLCLCLPRVGFHPFKNDARIYGIHS